MKTINSCRTDLGDIMVVADVVVSGVMADVLFYAASDYLHIFLT